jgi:hypothetical protein
MERQTEDLAVELLRDSDVVDEQRDGVDPLDPWIHGRPPEYVHRLDLKRIDATPARHADPTADGY